jgi:PAS domain S-box-containing protein
MTDLPTQAYEVLYEKQDEFFGALSAFVDAVITVDRCGAVTFVNNSARALTGWTVADAKGKRLNVVIDIVGENAKSVLQYPAGDSTGLSVTLSEGTYLSRTSRNQTGNTMCCVAIR